MRALLVFLLTLAVLSANSHISAAEPAEVEQEMKRIETLNQALSKGGIGELLATARARSAPCSLISSKYFVERNARRNPALVKLEQAKRNFALNLAKALDATAAELQRQVPSEKRATQAAELFDLADWLKPLKGYGNYILVSRCENLATVPLAYLTADLSYPMEQITALRNRLSPSVEERAFRVSVLNREATKPFIEALRGSESEKDEQMQIAWNRGWHSMSDWFSQRGITRDRWKRELLPEELAFFFNDEHAPDPLTTVNTWESKRHSTLIFGLRDKQVEHIEILALYREKVGKFPMQPPKWWKPDDKLYTATEAAFEEAWKPYRHDHGAKFQTAAQVYQEVTSGAFLDGETQLRRLAQPVSK